MQKKHHLPLFPSLPRPLSFSIPAQNIIEEDVAAVPSLCSSGRKKKAKCPLLSLVLSHFYTGGNKDKNIKHKPPLFFSHLNPVVLQVVTFLPLSFIPVRMGENLSTHPESKEAGCSSIMSVCPLFAYDVD